MITIITPTCDRQFGIDLLEKYVARQTVQPDQWIVADGGQVPAKLTMGQTHIHNPQERGAGNLTSNMKAALAGAVGSDVVAVMEDDDWYRQDHLERALEGLREAPVYGCNWLNYYHVGVRRWARFQNVGSALCQTAFRGAELPMMMGAASECESQGSYGIDGKFWVGREHLATGPQTVIGMKGLPGVKGLGVGHRSHPRVKWSEDPDLAKLREWIGDDAGYYEQCAV